MEFGRLQSTFKDFKVRLAQQLHDLSITEKDKKERAREAHALAKKSNLMLTEFDYNKMRKECLTKDLETQKGIAEAKRIRFSE